MYLVDILKLIASLLIINDVNIGFCNVDKIHYKNVVKAMFDHAFDSYMKYAYPADELMPLSCSGRYRNSHPSRGDIDDSLGNFSLTLVDSLDSLFIFKSYDKFELALKNTLNLTFEADVEVSVFETNIRVLGGLLGAHISALALKKLEPGRLLWYTDQMLAKAVDLANRLLPAFETKTGMPFSRVNLKTGKVSITDKQATCTACAGTLILEFGALSRLTNNTIYEAKARKALDYLWLQRNQYSDLVGTVINVNNGDWIRRESGVGAGIDSYYEYLFKAYILLGDSSYLHRFQAHYVAVQKFMKDQTTPIWPYLFLNVEMHSPTQRSRHFMDALLAFWPGIQVMSGDVKDAVAMHEMLYQIMKKYHFLPEAFTPDMKVHWGHHLLRPEFIESTYFLYQATHDPYYLQVARTVVDNLEKYTRVPCGYAAIKDVRTMEHLDQMDSYFLAETCKYLYLIFSEDSDIPIQLEDYVFTTEAHILPTKLSLVQTNLETNSKSQDFHSQTLLKDRLQCKNLFPEAFHDHQPQDLNSTKSCSSISCLFRWNDFTSSLELTKKLWIFIDNLRVSCRAIAEKLSPSPVPVSTGNILNIESLREKAKRLNQMIMNLLSFDSGHKTESADTSLQDDISTIEPPDIDVTDPNHLASLRKLGIEVKILSSGQVQLVHNQEIAQSSAAAIRGAMIIQKIIQTQEHVSSSKMIPRDFVYIGILSDPAFGQIVLKGGIAQFGSFPADKRLISQLRIARPVTGCGEIEEMGSVFPTSEQFPNLKFPNHDSALVNSDKLFHSLEGSIAVVLRGDCLFMEKAQNLQKAGAIGMIVVDNAEGSNEENSPLFSMSSDGTLTDDLTIASSFIYAVQGFDLLSFMRERWLSQAALTWIHISPNRMPGSLFSAAFHFSTPPSSLPSSISKDCMLHSTVSQIRIASKSYSSKVTIRMFLKKTPDLDPISRLVFNFYTIDPGSTEELFSLTSSMKLAISPSVLVSNLREKLSESFLQLDCVNAIIGLAKGAFSQLEEINESGEPFLISQAWLAYANSCIDTLNGDDNEHEHPLNETSSDPGDQESLNISLVLEFTDDKSNERESFLGNLPV